jgi:hypothetical protein
MMLLSRSRRAIWRRRAEVTCVLVVFALTAPADAATLMSLSFSWRHYHSCEIEAPAFRLAHVPPGTNKLAFNMVDENLRDFPPDGATIPYPGHGTIPAGAFKYVGPCPDRPHAYRWTVKALGLGGRVLALASATRLFPLRNKRGGTGAPLSLSERGANFTPAWRWW